MHIPPDPEKLSLEEGTIWFKWPKTWCTLSITYSINPRGCPPLGTIFLGQAVMDSCDLFVFVWSFKNYHCCRVAEFILLRFINCHPLTCMYSTVELTVYLHQSQNRHLLFASCQLPMFIYLVTNETNNLCICCTMSILDEPSYTFFKKWIQCTCGVSS